MTNSLDFHASAEAEVSGGNAKPCDDASKSIQIDEKVEDIAGA